MGHVRLCLLTLVCIPNEDPVLVFISVNFRCTPLDVLVWSQELCGLLMEVRWGILFRILNGPLARLVSRRAFLKSPVNFSGP